MYLTVNQVVLVKIVRVRESMVSPVDTVDNLVDTVDNLSGHSGHPHKAGVHGLNEHLEVSSSKSETIPPGGDNCSHSRPISQTSEPKDV